MTDRLSRFTPNAPGLDRDAILFAAGKRAGRGSWAWKVVAILLAVSQAVTLVALWPREVPTVIPIAPPQVIVPPADRALPAPSPPGDVWTVRSSPDVIQAPPSSPAGEFVSSGPPLTIGSGLRFD